MTLLSGINHAALITHDLDRVVEFYTSVFGAEVVLACGRRCAGSVTSRCGAFTPPGRSRTPNQVPNSDHNPNATSAATTSTG
jgi:catechol 2,3-dioxygenase-like lactoylglutathione lyase family enzyme